MKTRLKSILAVALAATSLSLLPAAADGPRGCATGSGGRSFSGSVGNVRYSVNGGNHNRGYNAARYERHEAPRPVYTERCNLIDTDYFTRGCDRFARKTFLHERIDCRGNVVKCWKTCETVKVRGGHRGH